MINIQNIKPILDNEDKIVKKNIKNQNFLFLLTILKNYSISDNNKDRIKDFFLKNKKNKIFHKKKLLIISDSTFKVFSKKIIDCGLDSGVVFELFFLSINELLNLSLKSFEKKYDYVFLYIDNRDFVNISSFDDGLLYRNVHLHEITNFYDMVLDKINKYTLANVIISTSPDYQMNEFGNYSLKVNNSKKNLVNKFNIHIIKKAKEFNYLLFDTYSISNQIGIINFYDHQKYVLGKIPFSINFSNYFFYILSNIISISLGEAKKVLVLDLDNTIWGGVVGDDGYQNIQLGPNSPTGIVFQNFQKVLRNFKERGLILAICSKNNLENVIEVFNKNHNMILKESDISCFRVNWNDKAENIKSISKELNVSLESFIFIDDNPVERDVVRTFLPEVFVPEMPKNISEFSNILLNYYIFDTTTYSSEDKKRTKTYINNEKRENLKKNFNSYEKYLSSLSMVCEVSNFKASKLDRVAQLFQRSNQFNLTTIRYDMVSLSKMLKNNNIKTFQFSLKDKFSDYGIISLLVCSISKEGLIINNWVMSCRVLGRTLEVFIIRQLIIYCIDNGISQIIGHYIKSDKNNLVADIYAEMQFKKHSNNKKQKKYVYNVRSSFNMKTQIIRK
tara:strand:+ start:348 stop:2198 length:1851 start_codon:yes stop_codon:yes gene_type:complete